MKVNTFSKIIFLILAMVLVTALFVCTIGLNNNEFLQQKENCAEEGYVIEDLQSYVKSIKTKFSYDTVRDDMRALNVTKAQFENPNLISQISPVTVKKEVMYYNSNKQLQSKNGTIGLIDRDILEIENETVIDSVTITTSITDGGFKLDSSGNYRNVIEVTAYITFSGSLSRTSVDLIEVKGDKDLVDCTSNSVMYAYINDDTIEVRPAQNTTNLVYKWDNNAFGKAYAKFR